MSDTAPSPAPTPEAASDTAKAPGGGQAGNRRLIRAIVLGPVLKQNLTTGQSKELPTDDLLDQLTADGRVVEPPFDKLVLAMLPEQSTSLGQVADAMVQNVAGFGYRFECQVRIDAPDCPPELKDSVLAEKSALINFFGNCCVDYSFTELMRRTRHDMEITGEAFWEVIRAPSTGKITGLNHIPSHQVRLGRQDKEYTQFQRNVKTANPDGTLSLEQRTMSKRFRQFVQARITSVSRSFAQSRGYQVRWFKEYGDPRTIDNRDGTVVPADKLIGFKEEDKANEMIHWKIYSPRTPYGLPRYIGNLITLFGDRAADEINFITLRNNNIPSMVILVSNGQLTEHSITRIQEFVESQIHGSDNYSRFLLLEGEGQFEGTDTGHVKIDIKPLTEQQMRDQLFQEYSKNNRDKVRESFRLPPIFVGVADEYTRATAEASRRLADEQIFKPERDEDDSLINKLLMADLGALYHVFKSNGPNVTDDEDLIKILQAAERTGGMTPRIARLVLADIFGREDLPPLDPSVKPDVPFSIQLAEAIKNTAPIEAQLAVKSNQDIVREHLLKGLFTLRDEMESQLDSDATPERS